MNAYLYDLSPTSILSVIMELFLGGGEAKIAVDENRGWSYSG